MGQLDTALGQSSTLTASWSLTKDSLLSWGHLRNSAPNRVGFSAPCWKMQSKLPSRGQGNTKARMACRSPGRHPYAQHYQQHLHHQHALQRGIVQTPQSMLRIPCWLEEKLWALYRRQRARTAGFTLCVRVVLCASGFVYKK